MLCWGLGLAAGKRQALVGYDRPTGRTPPSRGTGGAQPGRISLVRNVITPMGSGYVFASGKPSVRKAQFPSGCRTIPEANAGG
jgi:hypothetical protein